MKKSFILHIDSLCVLKELTKEQKGDLFQAIYDYNLGNEVQLEGLLKVVFLPFQNQFVRDAERYDSTCQKRREAGAKGGKQKVANATNSKQTLANLADNKNDSDSDSDNKNKNIIPTLDEFLFYCQTIENFKFEDFKFSLTAKYEAWFANGWKDGNNNKIKNWKTKIKNTIPFLKATPPPPQRQKVYN